LSFPSFQADTARTATLVANRQTERETERQTDRQRFLRRHFSVTLTGSCKARLKFN